MSAYRYSHRELVQVFALVEWVDREKGDGRDDNLMRVAEKAASRLLETGFLDDCDCELDTIAEALMVRRVTEAELDGIKDAHSTVAASQRTKGYFVNDEDGTLFTDIFPEDCAVTLVPYGGAS